MDEIDFDKLPKSFVLKTNHDGGGVVLVPNKESFLADKNTFQAAMGKLKKHLDTNYYTLFREWHYKDIEPRIFAEELLGCDENVDFHKNDSEKLCFHNSDSKKSPAFRVPDDYKFHCFGRSAGFEVFLQIDTERFTDHKRTIFDSNYEKIPLKYLYEPSANPPQKPQNFEQMLKIAKLLGASFGFLRVDLYNVCERIFVGELTFTPEGGTGSFTPFEWDEKWGALWV